MIKFLKEIEVLTLLGVVNANTSRRNIYIKSMLSLVLSSAIKRAFDESDIAEEYLDRILNLIATNPDPSKLQVEVVKLIPQTLNLIEEESYKLKKELLGDLLNEVSFEINNTTVESNLDVFIPIIAELKLKLKDDNETNFAEQWNLFSNKRMELLILERY
ncbi:MAG: hypothetical protein ACMG57_05610 [Candidatus Dojkabacteria bacterium]